MSRQTSRSRLAGPVSPGTQAGARFGLVLAQRCIPLQSVEWPKVDNIQTLTSEALKKCAGILTLANSCEEPP